jgi:RHS repeat-associated protein
MDGSNAYVYAGGGAPIEQVELSSGTVHYLVDDALGSVRGVVDSSGAVVATASYDAWGNAESGSDVAGYTSFDPTTGQFLTVDPDLQRTQEPFTYTTDDPVNNVDPLGLYNKLRTIASGYFFGYYEALNQVTTGRGKNVKPGMVRIQYQITALGPTIADTVIITGRIQNLTHPELGIQVDSTPPDITLQPTAHPSVLAYPGDKILANGTATQLDGTLVLFVGSCVAPAVKVKSRGTQFPGAVGASGVSGTGPTGASGVPGTGP